jgi:hypothetical protein
MTAPHPIPLPLGERDGVRGEFWILVIGAYLVFGAWKLVLVTTHLRQRASIDSKVD